MRAGRGFFMRTHAAFPEKYVAADKNLTRAHVTFPSDARLQRPEYIGFFTRMHATFPRSRAQNAPLPG